MLSYETLIYLILILSQNLALLRPNLKYSSSGIKPTLESESSFHFVEGSVGSDESDIDSFAWLQLLPLTTDEKPDMNLRSVGVPNLKAWQLMNVELPKNIVNPPSLFEYLYKSSCVQQIHQNEISKLWSQITKHGSLRRLKHEDTIIKEAFRVAYIGLWGKKTGQSSEESINRARGIVEVLGELDVALTGQEEFVEVILAGMLHDVVSEYITHNPNYGEREIFKQKLTSIFGDKVILLAERYNRLPTFPYKRASYTNTTFQGENFLQKLVTEAEEYRTLYIRLADRLHTLRVLKSLPLDPIDKNKIAMEARHVYVPLAHKMNLMTFKGELEDISFSILEAEAFKSCKLTRGVATKVFGDAEEDIKSVVSNDPYLTSQQIRCDIESRVKSTYQLYLKMSEQNLRHSNEVKDTIGFRIIIDCPRRKDEDQETYETRSYDACYHIVEKVRRLNRWTPEATFKDYIRGAKKNGYQSIHQYVRHKTFKIFVEVQIRTRTMHQNAQLGEAAHWYYKDTRYRKDLANSKLYKLAWRSGAQMKADSHAAFFKLAKEQILSQRVLVYTDDQTTILNLEKNCSALDGAFAVHSDIGLSTTKVLVNNKPVPLYYKLKNGDVISAITTPDKTPCTQPEWLQWVRSDHAKELVRKQVNRNVRNMRAALGCVKLLCVLTLSAESVAKRFEGENKLYPDVDDLQDLLRKNTNYMNIADFLVELGHDSNEGNSRKKDAALIGKLLDVEPQNLTTTIQAWTLTWARTQEIHGWDDKEMRNKILMPLLNHILPAYDLKYVKDRWIELIGPKSLTDQQSQYFNALSRRLIKHRSRGIDTARPIVDVEVITPADQPTLFSYIPDKIISSEISSPSFLPMVSGIEQRIHKHRLPTSAIDFVPKRYPKSPYAIARTPYCLEAPTLPASLLRSAKQNYADMALKNEKKQKRYQMSQ